MVAVAVAKIRCLVARNEAEFVDLFFDMLKAFCVGGLICVFGQILIDHTKLTPGKILVSFVVLGVFLGAIGVYEYVVRWAGSGATIPIVGFGYNLAKGTKEAVEEMGLLGVLWGPLASASVGVMAAIITGLVMSVFCRPKMKS